MLCIKYCTMYVWFATPHRSQDESNKAWSFIPINQCYHQDFTEYDKEFEKNCIVVDTSFQMN